MPGRAQPLKGEATERPRRLEPWRIHFFARDSSDGCGQSVPARDFLDACPDTVRAKMLAALQAVAEAPPPAFSGGGYWEAMHGAMAGYYEVRVDGPRRQHFRLFCVLERAGRDLGLGGPAIVLLTGMVKAFRTTFSSGDYRKVRQIGDEYRAGIPRSVAK
jgi:hypothetical protein